MVVAKDTLGKEAIMSGFCIPPRSDDVGPLDSHPCLLAWPSLEPHGTLLEASHHLPHKVFLAKEHLESIHKSKRLPFSLTTFIASLQLPSSHLMIAMTRYLSCSDMTSCPPAYPTAICQTS
jgi:hypothetical protein